MMFFELLLKEANSRSFSKSSKNIMRFNADFAPQGC
jgi:hypothetical protein